MKDSTDNTADRGPATDFRTAFAALALEMQDETHPEDDELVLYHQEELPTQRQNAVKEHLLTCRQCFAVVQDLRSFAEAERAEPATTADFETAAFYRALRPHLEEIDARNPQPRSGASLPNTSRWNNLATLAATFGVAALGLSLWALSQQRTISIQTQQIAQLSGIQANVNIHNLRPIQRDGRTTEPEISSVRGTTLVLTPELPAQATAVEIWFRDAAGSVPHKITDLEEDPSDSTLTLWLPPGTLPSGSYQVELHVDGREIESYGIQVVSLAALP